MSEGKRKLYTKKRENSRETARGAAKEAHKSKTEYTAKYTVQRSDTLLDFLLKKCNQSRNNVKSLLSGGSTPPLYGFFFRILNRSGDFFIFSSTSPNNASLIPLSSDAILKISLL